MKYEQIGKLVNLVRLFAAIACAIIALGGPAAADIVYTYSIDGTDSVGALSGSLVVDATTGKVTSADISGGALGIFTNINEQATITADGKTFYLIDLVNTTGTNGFELDLDTPTTLFAGQQTTIDNFSDIHSINSNDGNVIANNLSGNLTIGSAVPEPSTWTMIILGFAGVGFAAYRQKQNRPQLRLV
jgi:PEP-CTERM motif